MYYFVFYIFLKSPYIFPNHLSFINKTHLCLFAIIKPLLHCINSIFKRKAIGLQLGQMYQSKHSRQCNELQAATKEIGDILDQLDVEAHLREPQLILAKLDSEEAALTRNIQQARSAFFHTLINDHTLIGDFN